MSQFHLIAGPQRRAEVLLRLDIRASFGATAQIGAPPRKPINLVGSTDYCRPRS